MVSPDDPADGAVDRPRMAEALASLNEGLRESADPLYDGWKRRSDARAASGKETSSTGVDRPAFPSDTVRVRVIRYQVFPKWALIAAASLVVFSGSVAALRVGLRSPVKPPPASSSASPGPRMGPAFVPDLAVAADPGRMASDPPLGAAADQAFAELPLAPSAAAAVSAPSLPPSHFSSPRRAPPAPATKVVSPPTRRRPTPLDTGFFRDPGF